MTIIRNISYIVVSIVILLATSGFTIEKHVCLRNNNDCDIFQNNASCTSDLEKTCCISNNSNSCCSIDSFKPHNCNCCFDEIIYIQIENKYITSKYNILNILQAKWVILDKTNEENIIENNHIVSNIKKPPIKTAENIRVNQQIFLL